MKLVKNIKSIDFDFVICNIPFPVLRRIELIGLSESKNRAIRNLSYTSMFWDESEWAGGAFCIQKPGDVINYYEDTISPEGNLFFAGEHCSLDRSWIQGAIISAIRAIKDVVSK